MLEYAVHQWDMNKDSLYAAIRTDTKLNCCNYDYLVKLVVRHILNGKHRYDPLRNWTWDETNIVQIDHGYYTGTLLFVIPRNTCQPAAYEYLATKVEYGSCSGCDTLQDIQSFIRGSFDQPPTPQQASDFMKLCLDITTNLVHPFPCPWNNDGWAEMKLDKETEEHA